MCYGSGYNMAGQPCSCGSLRTRILSTGSEIDQLRAENAELTAQLAAAEKDAERYRWLRSNHPIHDNSPFICRNFGATFSQWTDDQADKAIDAAIAAQKGEKHGA